MRPTSSHLILLSIATIAIANLAACTTSDVCFEAAEHLATCTGQTSTNPISVCDPEQAEALLAEDCQGVRAAANMAGKGDSFWGELWCDMGYYSYCAPFDTAHTDVAHMVGRWKLSSSSTNLEWRDAGSTGGCPPLMDVIIGRDEGPPSLKLRQVDSTQRVYDRADFTNINGSETCESVDLSATEALKICHRTRITAKNRLTHRVWTGKKLGIGVKFIPTGSLSTTQELTLRDADQGIARTLVYAYAIDSEVQDRCVYSVQQ
ncbi:MAG: hypothetical protein KAI47_22345 [Deltaproteobacteria bacterium]|nr:hypothetical protein [Deltaproteobacteria bacterium]